MTLKEYDNSAEAYIDKGFLCSNGIHAIVEGSALSTVFGLTSASGNAAYAVCVPDNEYEEARKLLESRR